MDARAVGEQRAPLDGVVKLPHVPRPVVRSQPGQGVFAESPDRPVVLLGEALQEVMGQGHEVLTALAQGRQVDADHVEAKVEVLAEVSGRDAILEGLVGGRHDPGVGAQHPGAAQAVELLLLEDPQQLRLDGGRHVADLVQEERAAARLLEATDAPGDRRR